MLSALFDMFLLYDWPFLHVFILQENLLLSTLLGSVFSDYVVFYGDNNNTCISVPPYDHIFRVDCTSGHVVRSFVCSFFVGRGTAYSGLQ